MINTWEKINHTSFRFILFLISLGTITATSTGKSVDGQDRIYISSGHDKTSVTTDDNGDLLITVSQKELNRFIEDGYVMYSDFGARGDGETDDFDAIAAAHKFANANDLPIDETILFIKGGRFTTIANNDPSEYTYYRRGIEIMRSNVLLDGLEHYVTGEDDQGAPYSGFIIIRDCAFVTVQNTILTGRKRYETIGRAGVTVPMGSYDISVNRALNVSFINCSQTNDINDNTYWGIMGSNYSKNLVLENCTFSRFDAHMGVANATIRNSTLGYQGINAIGSGTFLLENSTIYGRHLINLRPDYGSTWQGEFHIRNCTFIPASGRTMSASLIGGTNTGKHNFGYTCYMPERIIIENLHINDSNHPEDYQGPAIFGNFNQHMTDDTYIEDFPYIIAREVILRNVTTTSGHELRVSDNPFMFRKVKLIIN